MHGGGGAGPGPGRGIPQPDDGVPKPRNYRQTVCTYWLRGLCMKGDTCGFLHQFDPERMPVCRSLLKFGVCKEPGASGMPPCCRYSCLLRCYVCSQALPLHCNSSTSV